MTLSASVNLCKALKLRLGGELSQATKLPRGSTKGYKPAIYFQNYQIHYALRLSKEGDTIDNFQAEALSSYNLYESLAGQRPYLQALARYANLLRGWDTPEYL